MAQLGLTPTEIASLQAALAANGIGTSWLHRWCWRRGWALPPAALMSLPAFLLWQVLKMTAMVFSVLGLIWLVTQIAVAERPIPGMLVSLVILGFIVKFLWAKRPGAERIAALLLAVTIGGGWMFLVVIYLQGAVFDLAMTRDWLAPLCSWVVVMASPSHRQRYSGPHSWRDYWHGATVVEAF